MIFSGTFRCFDKEQFEQFVDKKRNIEIFCSLNDFHELAPTSSTYEKYVLPEHWKFVDNNIKWNNYNTCSMYYHNMMAFNKLSHLKPDIVIKFRSDVIPNSEFPDIIPEKNTIYHPKKHIFNGINDQIALGDYESMKIYCDLYNHLENYVVNDHCAFHPETLLHFHLKKQNISIKTFDFDYELSRNRAEIDK
jgi:hypothetical protein